MLDVLIRNAFVFDGQGNPPQRLTLGIQDGLITHLAPNVDEKAHQELDAEGLWLAPGFVDIHTHYDIEVEIASGLGESVRHGVTSVLMGNCSLSVACGEPKDLADVFMRVETIPSPLIQRWLPQAAKWHTPADYLAHLDTLPLGPNVAVLLGHSALRLKAMGFERAVSGHATQTEIASMRSLVEDGLAAGFTGLSVDMVHWHKVHGPYAGRALPSHHADFAEYAALADACRERDVVFQATPNPERWRSGWNILKLGARGVGRPPLRMTVLSALDLDIQPHLWRLYGPLLWLYNRLLGNNLRLQTLADPFTIYSDGPITPLFEEFPAGVMLNNAADAEGRRRLWRTPAFRDTFEQDWTRRGAKTFHRDLARIRIIASHDESQVGLTVAEAASRKSKRAIDHFMDMLEQEDESFRWVSSGANNRPSVRQRLMAHPHILPGFTDAGAHTHNLAYFDGALSLLRQALRTGFLTPQRAIQRITGEPAAWLNLDVGYIALGKRADLVLLDPTLLTQEESDVLMVEDPAFKGTRRLVNRHRASPVRAVFIAGKQTVQDGQPLPELGRTKLGAVLRPRSPIHGRAAVLARYRNRLDDLRYDHSLPCYWDVFVMKHRQPINIWLHVLAVILLYGSPVMALALGSPWWLVGLPLSTVLGQIGHAVYEPSHVDTRDAVFSLRAFSALTRMAGLVLTGRYSREIARVQAAVKR